MAVARYPAMEKLHESTLISQCIKLSPINIENKKKYH